MVLSPPPPPHSLHQRTLRPIVKSPEWLGKDKGAMGESRGLCCAVTVSQLGPCLFLSRQTPVLPHSSTPSSRGTSYHTPGFHLSSSPSPLATPEPDSVTLEGVTHPSPRLLLVEWVCTEKCTPQKPHSPGPRGDSQARQDTVTFSKVWGRAVCSHTYSVTSNPETVTLCGRQAWQQAWALSAREFSPGVVSQEAEVEGLLWA